MPRSIIDLDEPDSFTAKGVGDPGDRTFFLQATKGVRVGTVVLEKEQLAILAERMLGVLDELERRGLAAIDADIANDADGAGSTDLPQSDFHVGTLSIGWDEEMDRLVVDARSRMHDDGAGESGLPDFDEEEEITDDAPIGPDVLRVRLKPLTALRFARQAARVIR